ncbi:MAG: hypothetical protein KJ607_03385, partial [Bacteroidetes bacterium]|nr:hypothetical protein [Bacteroidota bacterium]
MCRLLVICVLLLFSTSVIADSLGNGNAKILHEILYLHLDHANELIRAKKKANPQDMHVLYLENTSAFLRLILGEEESLYPELTRQYEARCREFEVNGGDSPEKRCMEAEMH